MRLRNLLVFHNDELTSEEERRKVAEMTELQRLEAEGLAEESTQARNKNHFAPRIAAAFNEANRRGA